MVWNVPFRPSSEVFDAFERGQAWGEREGGQIRGARAYRKGGIDAVAEAAGGAGDFAAMEAANAESRRRVSAKNEQRQFADEHSQAAYERMEQIAPFALNLLRASRDWAPERRRAFLQQHQQRFLDFGMAPEHVAAGIAGLTDADPAVRAEWESRVEAGFTQHQAPDWRPMAPDEMVGFQPGTVADINTETGERRVRQNPHYGRAAGDVTPALPDGYSWED